MERAVFLDRDGTIIEQVNYLYECSQVKFPPKSAEAIKLLNENGFKVFVITNQPGVARGYFTEDAVKEVNKYMEEYLSKQGATIDRFYYCPHHPEGTVAEYTKECDCRKPKPGMIEEASREFGIDLTGSFVIGDRLIDVEAGQRAGCRTILLGDKGAARGGEETALTPDYVAADLYEAVKWLISNAT